MKRRFFPIIFLIFCAIPNTGFSQDLDSLYLVAKTTKNDSVKIRLYNKIAFSYIFNDANKAIRIIKEGKSLAKKSRFNFGLTELTNTHGIYMDVTGESDSANYYFKKALELSRIHKISAIESMCLNNLGMYNWNRGKFQVAQDYFFQSLKMNEAKGDRKSTSYAFNNIGLIYQELNMFEEALEYHKKSYEIRKEFNLKKAQAASLNNIGICLKNSGKYNESLEVYNKGLSVAKTSNNLTDYYKILENIGSVYEEKQDYVQAANYYYKSLNTSQDLPDNKKGNLIVFGKLIGVYNKLNKPTEAIQYALKAKKVLEEFPHYKNYSDDFLVNSAESYFRIGNHVKARQLFNEFVTMKDSLFSEKNASILADLETKYQTEKKEKEILLQRADIAEKELNLNRKNTQLFGLGILAIVIAVLGYLLFNQQKLKNAQLKKEGELKEALVKIETQNRLQEQRLRISRDLHDNIGAQLTFIISSIDNLKYGFKITNTKLNSKLGAISNFTKDTIYELRDTIWAMNKNEISLENLQARVSNFVDKASASANKTSFNFNIDESLSNDLQFTSVNGMNIYRIIQEAINNAIKYAEASNINVEIIKETGMVKFSINDDGIGFDKSKIVTGNGINNMKKRAQDINANINIESVLGKGTSIKLTV